MVDALFRVAYRGAYQLMRVYWSIRKPATHGALVAIWVNGRILLIKNSYVRYFSLPGGYVKGHENGIEAAIRELREEVNLSVAAADLKPSVDETHVWEGKQERLEIFELELAREPKIQVDNREVVAATFYEPSEALGFRLFPLLRKHIEQKVRAQTEGVWAGN
jgi:ADP-ribose pyrophosphatase YjhB (NUDIX family)